ncbi:MAG TPA: hypothetical protein VF668_05550 [Pyrinomonadaceae bacterium]|jgi:hypothetical protein
MNVLVNLLLAAACLAALAPPPQAPRLAAEDLRRLTGARWEGTLTYTDYGSGRRVSIRSTLTVTQSADDEAAWVFEYGYPDEPGANSKGVARLGEGGTLFDGQKVVGRTHDAGGALRVVTEKRGRDDGREALLRYTYTFGASSFSVRKEARPSGAAGFSERNVYSWTR